MIAIASSVEFIKQATQLLSVYVCVCVMYDIVYYSVFLVNTVAQ